MEAIFKYGFSCSEYPVIVSFEIHCSAEQQDQMANIILDVFGDMLVVDVPEGMLHSPASLLRKFLLKAKVLGSEEFDPDDEFDENRSSTTEKDDTNRKKKDRGPLSKKLQSLVYFKNRKFIGLEKSQKAFQFDNMCSLVERSALALTKSKSQFTHFNNSFVTRIYPNQIRVNSSNFDPIPFWTCGVSMAAINFQTYGRF